MSTLRELWTELRASSTGAAPGFSLRLFLAAHDLRLYAGLKSPGGLPAIVIEMPTADRPRDLGTVTTRAFDAVAAQFPGLPQGRSAIGIALREPEYEDLFEYLANDIATAVQSAPTSQAAARAIVRRIDRWRRFLERSRRRLTDEEMRGMLGELAVLARCVAKFGPGPAVSAWQGMGGLRDFELPEYSVEVKTYQAETGAAVRINDPQQLEGSTVRPVYLAVTRLARSDAAGRTLPETITLVEKILQDAPAVEGFRDRLADCGYMAVEAGRYTERFSINPLQLFAVRSGFPRIPAAVVPPGVTDVHFSIALSAITSCCLDAVPVIGGPTLLEGV